MLRLPGFGDLFRDVAKVSTGRLSAMAIAVLATPIVSRLFAPEHYGLAALVVAAVSITASFLPLSYERAILYPKAERQAASLLWLSLCVAGAVTAIVYLLLCVSALVWPDIAGASGMGAFFWIFPIGGLFVALKRIASTVCIREKAFSRIATADFLDAAGTASIRILWGLVLVSSAAGLLFGFFVGVAVATAICSVRALAWFRALDVRPTGADMVALLKEYRDYPIFRAPAKFAFTAAQRSPIIALGILFPVEFVGFYAIAHRAAALPLYAASRAVKDVLIQRIMKSKHDNEQLGGSLAKVAGIMAICGAPLFLVLHMYGEPMFSWLLGDRWSTAGRVAEILAVYLYLVWVGSVTATAFESLRLNKLRMKLYVGNLALRIAIFSACGFYALNFEQTLMFFVAGCALYQFATYFFAARALLAHDAGIRDSHATETPGTG